LNAEDERVVESAAEEAGDFESVAEKQSAERVREAVDALPAVSRALVAMYHLDEVPIHEIASITGMSEGTIKSHLFRARASMREWLRRRGVDGL
jgi:RNA polymerase sigma-70 factor (ECF subfamily)